MLNDDDTYAEGEIHLINHSSWPLSRHLKKYRWQYAIGTLLMIATIAVFAIPGALPAAFLALLASTGLSLMAASALFGTLAALLAFFAPFILGHTLKLLGAVVEAASFIIGAVVPAATVISDGIPLIGTVLTAGLIWFPNMLVKFLSSYYLVGKNLVITDSYLMRFVGYIIGEKPEQRSDNSYHSAPKSLPRKIIRFFGKLIGYPLSLLSSAIELTLMAIAAIALLAFIITVVPIVALTIVASYAAIQLGRGIAGLGRFCLGEGFHSTTSMPRKFSDRLDAESKYLADLLFDEYPEAGFANSAFTWLATSTPRIKTNDARKGLLGGSYEGPTSAFQKGKTTSSSSSSPSHYPSYE